jgi:hypothetical protein
LKLGIYNLHLALIGQSHAFKTALKSNPGEHDIEYAFPFQQLKNFEQSVGSLKVPLPGQVNGLRVEALVVEAGVGALVVEAGVGVLDVEAGVGVLVVEVVGEIVGACQ